MSCRVAQTEYLSPKAAAFSIENLLANSSKNASEGTAKVSTTLKSSLNTSYSNNVERRTAPNIKTPCFPSWMNLDSSEENYTNGISDDANQGKKTFAKQDCSNLRMDPNAIPGSFQQFALCCNLVNRLGSLDERHSSFKTQSVIRDPQQGIQVALQHSDLWWKFYACGTEMVITRTGR